MFSPETGEPLSWRDVYRDSVLVSYVAPRMVLINRGVPDSIETTRMALINRGVPDSIETTRMALINRGVLDSIETRMALVNRGVLASKRHGWR